MNNIAILGTGNMGKAIIRGLITNKTYRPQEIYATRRRLDLIEDIKNLGVHTTHNNKLAVQNAKWIIIAVKPYIVEDLLKEIKEEITHDHVLISIATGITLESMRTMVGDKPQIFRAMPNTATSVTEGITCICALEQDAQTTQTVMALFNHLGTTVVIEEKLMDAATVIGACGVAYALRFMRAMMQGAIEIGFDAQTASKIVSQMVKGSASMLVENGLHPEEEIDKVTTPMGCTITGLNEMEHRGFSSALIKGIKASYDKIEK